MSLAKSLNCGDRVATTKEHDKGVGVHYEGVIDDCAPWDFNALDILTDDGEIVNIHVKYLEKCEIPGFKMYAIKQHRRQDDKDYFHDIFDNPLSTLMCAMRGEKVFQIKVREALPKEETPYYAWKHPDGHINMIFPSKVQVEVCFAYGTKAATAKGDGHMIKVIVTEVNEKMNFYDKFSDAENEVIHAFFYEIELRGMTPQSLMESFRDLFGNYPKLGISTKIDSSRLLIVQKNKEKNIYYITIDDEVEFYYIEHQEKHWFFKDYTNYKYIEAIIYGKVIS